jgi:hypothetical protein
MHKRELNYKFKCWIKEGVSVQRQPAVTSRDMLVGKGKGTEATGCDIT